MTTEEALAAEIARADRECARADACLATINRVVRRHYMETIDATPVVGWAQMLCEMDRRRKHGGGR